jgi:ribonuclease J
MKTGSNRKRPTAGRKTRDGRNAGFKSFNSVRKPKNVKNSNRKTRPAQKPAQEKGAFEINFGTELNLPIRKVSQKPTRYSDSSKTTKHTTTRKKAENVKIIPIGGLDEIGKNMTVLEYKNQILIIDCGMSFPDNEMFGVDVVIPDFSYIRNNMEKVKGVVLTHGHEDHIGGVPYLLKEISVPIYGTRLTLGLVKSKLDEHDIKGDLRSIKAGDRIRLGEFTVEAIRTTHSIADAICLFIQTPAASIFHTGDFKIDYTPIDGDPIDFGKLAEIGSRGIDLMMCDSTNAVRPGFTPSERVVGETLERIFASADKRIIIATFSSNVHRVQTIIDLSIRHGRKFAISGRSMEKVVALAVELGYLVFPQNAFVELNHAKNIPDSEITIITTGSQGEPMSALTRMADDDHKNVKLKRGDTVVLSSTPVPGNEKTVSRVVNKLYEKEVRVIYNDIADIHVSGHGCQEDLKLMHSLIKPKFFMPVHGEHRHLIVHEDLAVKLGMKKDHIFILSNGDQLTVDRKKAIRFKNVVSAEDIMVDGLGVGDIGNIVLRDRKLLSESGLIIIAAAVDCANGVLISGPEIVSRGFVYVKENEELIEKARILAHDAIERSLNDGFRDWNTIKNDVRDELRKLLFKKTRRSPLILPVFIEL